jgi:hypothetical protein
MGSYLLHFTVYFVFPIYYNYVFSLEGFRFVFKVQYCNDFCINIVLLIMMHCILDFNNEVEIGTNLTTGYPQHRENYLNIFHARCGHRGGWWPRY